MHLVQYMSVVPASNETLTFYFRLQDNDLHTKQKTDFFELEYFFLVEYLLENISSLVYNLLFVYMLSPSISLLVYKHCNESIKRYVYIVPIQPENNVDRTQVILITNISMPLMLLPRFMYFKRRPNICKCGQTSGSVCTFTPHL